LARALIAMCAALLAPGVLGCGGGEPADISGEFTVGVTNRENGCNFQDWVEDEMTPGIPVTITQEGADASADVGGLVGVFLDLAFGSSVYTGEVDGDAFELTLFGTVSQSQGNCTFTFNSTIDAVASGDTTQGEIRYEAATNGNPDCADLEGCVSRQEFTGSRPPR
jgi:hypothetical protein